MNRKTSKKINSIIRKHYFLSAVMLMLLTLMPLSATAQNADQEAGTCMNQKDWFGLKDVYEAKGSMLSPFLRSFAQAMLDQTFNRKAQAIGSIKNLLRNHQHEMDFSSIVSMIYFLANDYSRLGQNTQAANTLKGFISQIKGKVDSSYYETLSEQQRVCEALAQYELLSYDSTKSYTLPFRIDSVGPRHKRGVCVMIPAKAGKTALDLFFDTGAGVNVMTEEYAKKMKLEIIHTHSKVEGKSIISGVNLAIMPQLQIGDLVMNNVPFYIYNTKTNIDSIDSYLSPMSCIIGIPFMDKVGEMQIDFRSHNILIPSSKTTCKEQNLCFKADDGTMLLRAYHNGEPIIGLLDTGNDNYGTLSYSYFMKHQKDIVAQGKADIERIAGHGGIRKENIYHLYNYPFTLAGKQVTLPRMDVYADNHEAQPVFGMMAFSQYNKLIINLCDMFVLAE